MSGVIPTFAGPALCLQVRGACSLCVDGARGARMLNRCTESERGQDHTRPAVNCPMQTETGVYAQAGVAALLPRPTGAG